MRLLFRSGVRSLRCRYLSSQPWPFPSSLMLGFFAEAGPDEPQVGDELEDARWFTFDEVDAALRGASPAGGLLLSPSVSIPPWLVEYWPGAMASQGCGARRPAAALKSGHVPPPPRRRPP